MSKGLLQFCKLISNLILGQIIVSNLTNEHKLAAEITLHFIVKLDKEKTKTKYNNYSGFISLSLVQYLFNVIK